MKQLEKLITKKVTAPATVKGGRYMHLEQFTELTDEKTTEKIPTWVDMHYATDLNPDPK